MDMSETRRPGRPASADPRQLRVQMLEIILREGYEHVTMSQLAAEAGISLRTLHRYFPAKGDIVWLGAEGGHDALRRELDAVDQGLAPLQALAVAVGRVFDLEVEEEPTARLRLRAIAAMPPEQSSRPDAYLGWRQEVAVFLARRAGLHPDGLVARAASAAVQAAMAEALSWWATEASADEAAHTAVERAFQGLEGLLGPASEGRGAPSGNNSASLA
ncbi:conserved hypothetical protein [Pseudoclavibacter sp. 8L]|nr:conserved hypothetical protein [Pseudoclavibacter sp. 8L]